MTCDFCGGLHNEHYLSCPILLKAIEDAREKEERLKKLEQRKCSRIDKQGSCSNCACSKTKKSTSFQRFVSLLKRTLHISS